MQRREFLIAGAAAATALSWRGFAASSAQPFDYAWLKGQARALAGRAYEAPSRELPPMLAALDYDQYQAIRYRPERSLWHDDGLAFRAQFFHRGYRERDAVRLHEVIGGQAREVAYDASSYDFGKSGIKAGKLPRDLGYAGFRLQYRTNWAGEFMVFLGASYFRAIGGDNRQYGISARGLAIDVGQDGGEEFPRFTQFWLERPAPSATKMVVYGLLDSPSVAGAYRFEIAPGTITVMLTDVALYPRREIRHLGLAPLTSMYYCGENDRHGALDWRPEIHDSDGLALWTGAGEWIWRPLVNPPGTHLNSFLDQKPRGYGLVQRDRDFDHYLDDAVYYEHRPSVWVEADPAVGELWNKGAVKLLEYGAPDETVDNIVAAWTPEQPPQAGQELLYRYKLHWGSRMPYTPSAATVLATRCGLGGVIGQARKGFAWRFTVDFVGGELPPMDSKLKVLPVITSSRGRIELTNAWPQVELNAWRVMFDLVPDDNAEPIDLRMFLKLDGQALSETWIYQWTRTAEMAALVRRS